MKRLLPHLPGETEGRGLNFDKNIAYQDSFLFVQEKLFYNNSIIHACNGNFHTHTHNDGQRD